jgi:hypothetical protein
MSLSYRVREWISESEQTNAIVHVDYAEVRGMLREYTGALERLASDWTGTQYGHEFWGRDWRIHIDFNGE